MQTFAHGAHRAGSRSISSIQKAGMGKTAVAATVP